MERVLVTGGAGFIGSNLVWHLLAHRPGVHIWNLDALTYAGRRENLDGVDETRHTFVHGDIRDRELVDQLLAQNRIDTIIHLAAESHVDRSILAPAAFIETNVVGTFTLLQAAKAARRPVRFHHVSTDEVYGPLEPGRPAVREGEPYAPSSPYAASKAASDHLVRAYVTTYALDATISSCSNNYGPRQFPEKLIPLFITNALAGKKLPVYGDGKQIRDWLHVEDHCEAIVAIVERGKSGETYHVAGGNQPHNIDIVEQLCDLVGPGTRDLIMRVADRPGHDRRYALDTTKIRDELGWQPRRSLADGLAETVAWYRGR